MIWLHLIITPCIWIWIFQLQTGICVRKERLYNGQYEVNTEIWRTPSISQGLFSVIRFRLDRTHEVSFIYFRRDARWTHGSVVLSYVLGNSKTHDKSNTIKWTQRDSILHVLNYVNTSLKQRNFNFVVKNTQNHALMDLNLWSSSKRESDITTRMPDSNYVWYNMRAALDWGVLKWIFLSP